MKILQINNYTYNRGGAETVFFSLVELLRSKNHNIITVGKYNDNSPPKVDYLISESQFFFNRFYSFKSKLILEKILSDQKPEIVHIHNIIGGITFSILPVIKRYRIPIVASIHDFRLLCPVGIFVNGKKEICEKCKVGKYYEGILNKCSPDGYLKSSIVVSESYLRDLFFPHSKFFDAYLFVSEFTKQKFLEYYPEIESKSYVLYNFTNTFSFTRKRGDYFLYFGRLDREKGLLTLLKAFSQLKNIKIIILGSGPFAKLIEQFNSNKNIEYLGFKTGAELRELIENSQYVIIPSECYETLSMSAVEALSLSKPIITSGLGGLKELLDDGNNGFIFEPGNFKSLKEVIIKAYSITDEEYFRMSESCFEYAKKHFDKENYYQKLISVYQSLVKN
ncbi:MAG: glycosyltransferase family 4 protein [Ignavibacteria bacterium]|nr:glycosyltransferase family 4 protein [Ignavibacteria bacterium]